MLHADKVAVVFGVVSELFHVRNVFVGFRGVSPLLQKSLPIEVEGRARGGSLGGSVRGGQGKCRVSNVVRGHSGNGLYQASAWNCWERLQS